VDGAALGTVAVTPAASALDGYGFCSNWQNA
jgi:hypothetical protein